MHKKHEQYLLDALSRMSHLELFAWSCNHLPISINLLWPILLKYHTLREVEIDDNLVFSPGTNNESEGDSSNVAVASPDANILSGSRAKGGRPEVNQACSLNRAYTQSRSLPHVHLSVDNLFLFGCWPNLTSLTLTNLRCSPSTGLDAASSFLFTHLNLEILHLDMSPGTTTCDAPGPLEIIKGVRLTQATDLQQSADAFFFNLCRHGVNVKQVALTSWHEMEDIQRLVESTPKLAWLNLGKKGNGGHHNRLGGSGASSSGAAAKSSSSSHFSVVNANEWAMLLSAAPELTTFHGVKFFYEVSLQAQASIANAANLPLYVNGSASNSNSGTGPAPGATAHVNLNLMNLSMTDRSRIRKNDETASMLA
ncbi:hypothetical protein GYMLUDRAFT_990145 [Collybiopsis luxurians FD-317 M1]|uniref:Uncharacterized protein n=1 Tax=Collybiopsis luxurians FD-317 M1 TaxID=944289 RepID=A0A0D0D101_9AGAR|nr:hypothetical protein GYMLUDRAFT_990145 [Collybiopsis luxurians FD-317 M1]